MKNKLYIPKKLNVGYQYRSDTYSKKLAYVIYWDGKGKLRKETSWTGWIQKGGDTVRNWSRENGYVETKLGDEYNPEVFDNVPMDGFVLNRGVGGTRESYGWNARNEYIRVFDPRGFEIEISVANLLFILQECTSTKGKGLEGEFVYSWSGTELVLLPTSSTDYIESSKFTNAQSKKITKKDVVLGGRYLDKNMDELVYLGRHEIRCFDYGWSNSSRENNKKKHVYLKLNYEESKYSSKYKFENGFTKLSKKIDNEPIDNYSDILDDFLSSKYIGTLIGLKCEDGKKFDLSKLSDGEIESEVGYNLYRWLEISNNVFGYYKISKKYKGGHYSNRVRVDGLFELILFKKYEIKNGNVSESRVNIIENHELNYDQIRRLKGYTDDGYIIGVYRKNKF